MKPAQVADGLRNLNKWRRGDESIPQPNPEEVGKLLDRAIDLLDGMANRSKLGQKKPNVRL